ncbi:CDPK-related protein kinase [Hordeum vulgare]|nr:CDPK-related protein kinase [Hordeum vulgare]
MPLASSGRGSGKRSGDGSDPERERRVWSDGARKHGDRRWTNRGMSPPAIFRVRETEEYDRRQVAAGSSLAAGSSSSARLLRVKSQWSEEPDDVVAVKEEPKELGHRGVVGPEDFVADVEAVAAGIV